MAAMRRARAGSEEASVAWLEHIVLAVRPLRELAYCRAIRYVAGLDEGAALETVRRLGSEGLKASADIFGENILDSGHAEARWGEMGRPSAIYRLTSHTPCQENALLGIHD
jgi:hypothetical protein